MAVTPADSWFLVKRGDTHFKCLGSELYGRIKDNDKFWVQRGDTSYYLEGEAAPPPWEIHDGGVFHVITSGSSVQLGGDRQVYQPDGTDLGLRNWLPANDEYIILTPPDASSLFSSGSNFGDFEFGALTDTSSVTNMYQLFGRCLDFNNQNKPLTFDVTNVTNMSMMFHRNGKFRQDINHWDVSNVTNMAGMFSNCTQFNTTLNSWNTTNVTDMSKMFEAAKAYNQTLTGWNVSNVTNMSRMFNHAWDYNKTLNGWNTVNVKDMYAMFRGESSNFGNEFNSPLNSLNTSNVENMSQMFSNCEQFDHPIESWNTSNVKDMSGMFDGNPRFNQPLNGWNTGNVTNMERMFAETYGGGYPPRGFKQKIRSWCVEKIKTKPRNFDKNSNVYGSDEDLYWPCWGGCPRGESGSVVPCPMPWDTHNYAVLHFKDVTGTINFHSDTWVYKLDGTDERVRTINAGQERILLIDRRGDTNFSFSNSTADWNFGIHTKTKNQENFGDWFRECQNFTGDPSMNSWDTSSVTNMSGMFWWAKKFNQNLSNWDTSSVTDTGMNGMFYQAERFSQNLTGWCVSNIPSRPTNFASPPYLNQTTLHPQWGRCP